LDKLGNLTKHRIIAAVPIQYIYEIAKIKKDLDPDMKVHTLENICRVKSTNGR
jgi:ribosomal protein L11